MSDTIGRITVPSITTSGAFPLVSRWPYGIAQKRPGVIHQFGSANAKIEQRFFVGSPARRFTFSDPQLDKARRAALRTFWESTKGGYGAFTYAVPQENGTTTNTTVCFESQPLTFNDLVSACSVGITFVEIPNPASAPSFSITSTATRFPGSTLAANLLLQAQEIIPLVKIRALDGAVPDIFLSDRRVTVGGQLYLPRLLRIGEADSQLLLSQSIDGSSDDVTLSLGNADRVMVQLANDTQLRWGRVELSLFRVDSSTAGTLLQLWAGKIIDWSSDSGPEFSLKCSDALSALTLSSPVGRGSRTCRRRYGQDGCPAVPGSQVMDLVHFSGSSNAACDLGYNTNNGCMAHQVITSFGATYGAPQSVVIKDNSTGVMGFGRNILNATSIISDTFYGKTLPEIWHSDDGIPQYGLPVTCRIVAGRDESDFFIALGAIGWGPLGALTAPQMWDSNADGKPDTFLGATLDGQPNHGLQIDSNGLVKSGTNPLLGLRSALGTDPAGIHDYFSLGRVSTTGLGWFTQASDGSVMFEEAYLGSAYNKVYAAGVALLEVRRTDTPGVQPSSPDGHSLIAMVSQGLAGFSWSAPGGRGSSGGVVNTFWVAINTFLRAMGLNTASAATQETYFDVDAAVAASAIAATVVPKVFGSGTETQFRFKGSLDDLRPVRDWVNFILTSGLGFYTWSFGKMKVGCRYNASAAVAFNAGNILFNSLHLEPIKPAFEKLVVTFQDQEYQYAQNTVEYVDQDYAGRNGRAQNPLTAEVGVTGCVTKSQAARIGVTRTREELGGVTQAEQDAARLASWRTTILALDTEPGMVASVTDADVPGGAGNFRVQRMSIFRDWSVEIQGKTVTPSMYDLTVGPKPADVQPARIPDEPERDSDISPAPTFGVEASALDPTVAEVAGVTFSDSVNTHTITAGNFTFYYVDEGATPDLLAANLTSGAASMTLASAVDISDGDLVQVGAEILLCGALAGAVVPITRAQLGSAAASASSGDTVRKVASKTTGAAFGADFFNSDPNAPNWVLFMPIPEMKLVSVAGYVVNAYGPSPITFVCTTGNADLGIRLNATPAGFATRNVTNTDTTLTPGNEIVNVVATTRDVTITLPSEGASVGTQKIVNWAPGSTHSVFIAEGSGDTIDLSAANITLNSSTTLWQGMAS